MAAPGPGPSHWRWYWPSFHSSSLVPGGVVGDGWASKIIARQTGAGVTCFKPGDEAGMSLCRACKVGGFDTQ